jgi:hypothetical protein
MDRNRIKFKYILGLWKTMPEYPTKEDVLYEISIYMVKEKRLNHEISEQTFNSIFGHNWQKSKHFNAIETMICDGDLTEIIKSPKAGSKKWYKINNTQYLDKL